MSHSKILTSPQDHCCPHEANTSHAHFPLGPVPLTLLSVSELAYSRHLNQWNHIAFLILFQINSMYHFVLNVYS